MTVKDLINELNKLDPSAEVLIVNGVGYTPLQSWRFKLSHLYKDGNSYQGRCNIGAKKAPTLCLLLEVDS
jgi:hypothetical protein